MRVCVRACVCVFLKCCVRAVRSSPRVPRRLRPRFTRSHTPSFPPDTFSAEPAIAFFTSWSNSFTEIFSRAVVRLFELWCGLVAVGALSAAAVALIAAAKLTPRTPPSSQPNASFPLIRLYLIVMMMSATRDLVVGRELRQLLDGRRG